MFNYYGYYKEFYLNGKYLGNINTDKDRDTIGYLGRKKELLTDIIILSNGKKLKANIEYETILYPLCGKVKQPINSHE